MPEQMPKETWEEGRDFISLSRSFDFPPPSKRRRRLPWRLWAAAVFLAVTYLVLQAWLPLPAPWREATLRYLTSPAADWTPQLARYFSLDVLERRLYSLGAQGWGATAPAGEAEAPALAPAGSGGEGGGPGPGQPQGSASLGGGATDTALHGLIPPVKGKVLRAYGTSPSAVDGRPVFHPGLDFAAAAGEQVKACLAGRVGTVEAADGLFTVRLEHGEGLATVYGRLAVPAVRPQRQVRAGEVIGTSAGGWVHFGAERYGRAVDPSSWFAP